MIFVSSFVPNSQTSVPYFSLSSWQGLNGDGDKYHRLAIIPCTNEEEHFTVAGKRFQS